MTSEKPAVPVTRDAAYFDQWYADMAASPARDAIVARTLGLPPKLQFASVLPWQGDAERDKPEWRQAERAMWEEAVAAVDADAAVMSLQAEGWRTLETFDSLRRVFATATAP